MWGYNFKYIFGEHHDSLTEKKQFFFKKTISGRANESVQQSPLENV